MLPLQLLGHGRLATAALVPLVSALYEEGWSALMKGFLPSLKFKKKRRKTSAWKKRYEPARTTFARLLNVDVLGLKARRVRCDQCGDLNLFELRDEWEKRLQSILAPTKVPRRPAPGSDRETTLRTELSRVSHPCLPTQNPSTCFFHEAAGPTPTESPLPSSAAADNPSGKSPSPPTAASRA